MSVLEIESPEQVGLECPGQESVVLPFDKSRALFSREKDFAVLCPNLTDLPRTALQRAHKALEEMTSALHEANVEQFNEARQQLVQIVKKHGVPVTQWNPLVLELSNPQMLKGAKLPNINLSMVSLRAGTGKMDKVSLQGCHLQGADFLCADLSQVILTEADLSGADLRFTDLREAHLEHTVLVESDLSQAKLSGAFLQSANLYCAKMNGAVIKQACLIEANLRRADLRDADLYQANLRFARLQRVDLREANLFMADLSGTRLRYADLRKANLGFAILREARMQGARFTGANLANADCTKADLQQCCLSGAQLNRAMLDDANLCQSQLQNADLSDASQLMSARMEGACFDDDTQFPKGFRARKHGLSGTKGMGLRRRLKRLLSRLFSTRKPLVASSAE